MLHILGSPEPGADTVLLAAGGLVDLLVTFVSALEPDAARRPRPKARQWPSPGAPSGHIRNENDPGARHERRTGQRDRVDGDSGRAGDTAAGSAAAGRIRAGGPEPCCLPSGRRTAPLCRAGALDR